MESIEPNNMQHIRLLSYGNVFPLPPIGSETLMTIASAIRDAFKIVCFEINKSPAVSIKSLDEDGITSRMQIVLNNMLTENPKVGAHVDYFARSASVVSYNGEKINKKPDLTAILADPEYNNFPITIEAKIIDYPQFTVSSYYNDGIDRYIQGDYSWYYQEAFMIAFVRDSSTIKSKLLPYLKTKKVPASSLPKQISEFDGDLATTKHQRSFKYVLPPSKYPGPITLINLWCKAS